MVSKASEDFPDPLTPVTIISLPTGSVTSMFLRLWVRAPRTTIFWASAAPAMGVSDIARCYDPAAANLIETRTINRSAGSYSSQAEHGRPQRSINHEKATGET